MRLPDFEAWAMFGAVVEHRSFTEAARALGVSKATVSKAVTRLELQLDTSLFNRTSRRLALTESGKRLAEHAARIMGEGEAAEEAAREEISELSGTVRLAAPMTFGLDFVAPAIADFIAKYPGITVDLHLSDETVDIVEMGLDATLRIAVMPDSSLRARRLKDVRGHIVAAPSYLERRGTPGHPSELVSHDCLRYANQSTLDSWRFSGPGGQQVSVVPTGPLRTNSGDAMLPALRAGLGIAILPDFIVDAELEKGTLVSILPEWMTLQVAVHLVTPPSRLRPARVEALLNFIAERFAR